MKNLSLCIAALLLVLVCAHVQATEPIHGGTGSVVSDLIGTTDQITVTDNGDGTATLSTPQDIATDSDVTFANTTLDDLTPSMLVRTGATNALDSAALGNFVSGTADQITVTDGADGAIVLSTPQDIDSTATPVFNSVVFDGVAPNHLLKTGSSGAGEAVGLSNFISAGSDITVTDAANGGITIASSGTAASVDAWNISAMSYLGKNLDVSSESAAPNGVVIVNSGADAFIADNTTNNVYRYSIGTAFNISTGTYAVQNMTTAAEETTPTDLAFSTDGRNLFVIGSSSDSIHQYYMTFPYDIGNASLVNSFSVNGQDSSPHGMTFNVAGTKLWVVGLQNAKAYQYSLSAWDIDTASYETKSCTVSAKANDPISIAVNDDMTKFIVAGSLDTYNEYILKTANDISTCLWVYTGPTSPETSLLGFSFSDNGYYAYGVGQTQKRIFQWVTNSHYSEE